jgi:parallel beta-helix repeat protein
MLIALVTLLFLAVPASANPPCGSTLAPNVTTLLDGPMVCPGTALVLSTGSNLNCKGFSITGPDVPPATCNPQGAGCVTGHYGVRVDGKSGTTVRKCTITQFERGIYATNVSTATFKDNVLHDNTRYGLQLSGSGSNNLLFNNVYQSNRDEGVHISDLTGTGNRSSFDQAIANVAEGFYLLNAANVSLEDCQTNANGAPGIYLKNSLSADILRCTLTGDNVQILQSTGTPLIIDHIATGP